MPHIVDVLIEERASKLMRRPAVWRFVQTFLYPLLNYEQAIHTIDRVQGMDGLEILQYLSEALDMKLECQGLACTSSSSS